MRDQGAEKMTDMQCLPDSLLEREYYLPTEQGAEARYKERLSQIKQWKAVGAHHDGFRK